MKDTNWRDRDRWASASVIPPLGMIVIGVCLWPVGIPALLVGAYLITIIGKAQLELTTTEPEQKGE